jgi:hypothetical protein
MDRREGPNVNDIVGNLMEVYKAKIDKEGNINKIDFFA